MLALLAHVAAFLVTVGNPAGPIVLADQYDREWRLSDDRGRVILLIDGDRDGNKFNSAWGRAVRDRYKDAGIERLKIAYVAHLSSVPAFMRGFVKGKFISKDPAHPSGRILLDWKGAIAQQFGFRENVSNVYVIDRDGFLRYAGSGQATGADAEALFRVLDGLLH